MKKQQSKVYKTTPYKDGCTNQVEYDTLDIYGSGSVHKFYAVTTRCNYVDKKGCQHTGHVLRVKWIEDWEYRMKKYVLQNKFIIPRLVGRYE